MLKTFDRLDIECASTLNTRVEPHIRILHGAIDECDESISGVILQGRIDPSTLRFIRADTYQRPLGDRADIFAALKEGKIVPPIEIGIRGQDFVCEGDDYIIHSPAFVIDGWQRVGTALRLLENIPSFPIRMFATVHFGTDELWERHRFIELNKNVKRVSPSIHLKNTRDTNAAISALHDLTMSDPAFPLYKRVSWSQNMQKGELLSALSLALVAQMLHGHRSAITGRSVHTISDGLERVARNVTVPTFRRNVATFIKLIDECWPFAAIEYRKSAPQVKQTFMTELARLLSRHPTFWEHNENTLFISADDRRKLSKFPINDPKISQLAGTGGAARKMLYQLLVDHLNSGRRTQRLRSRFEVESSADR